MEEEINRYRTLVGAYYGVLSIDEYDIKVYILKDIENLINRYEKDNIGIDFNKERLDVKDNVNIKVKWQDAIYILNELNSSKELIHLIRMRIKKYEKENI